MANQPTRGVQRAIKPAEAQRQLCGLIGALVQYVEYLQEQGIAEVACLADVSAADRPQAVASVKLVQPQPQANVVNLKSNSTRQIDESDGVAKLRAIAQSVAVCKKCALHAKRCHSVPGQGCLHPDILFIGEGPGEDEDKQGLAFVGRAGQMLTRLITRMGYTRDLVFIANIVKCRPPNNRKPLPEEMNCCRPYLEQQISLLQPKVIVLLGASAFDGLMPAALPGMTISKVRGKWLEYKGIPTMPTFHPSYLLRNPSAMWDVWSDMQQVLKHLGRCVPPPALARQK